MQVRACKQYIFHSYNTSTFSAVRLDVNPFTCLCQKRKQKNLRVQISHFQSSFSSDIVAVKGLTSTETLRLMRDGGIGGNDSCIKVGSDESHFNVSLTVRDKVTGQCPQTTTFSRKRTAEAESNRGPSDDQPNALPLGQTGSRNHTIGKHNA